MTEKKEGSNKKIGEKGQSKPKSYIIDCPGYMDTFGCYRILSNRFFHQEVLSKVKNAKFVVVFPYNDMDDQCMGLTKTFEEFLKGFANHEEIKEELFQATSILITKVPKGITISDLIGRYDSTNNGLSTDYN